MRTVTLVAMALSMIGCGSVWLDSVPMRARVQGTATVEVRASATAGGVEIVEQAPGQGFVVEGDGASFLARFEQPSISVSSTPCVLASNGTTTGCTEGVTASGGSSGDIAVAVSGASRGGAAIDVASGVGGSSSGESRGGAIVASGVGGAPSAGIGVSGASGGGVGATGTPSGASGGAIAIDVASGSASGSSAGGVAIDAPSGSTSAGGSLPSSAGGGARVDVASGDPGGVAIEARASVPRDGVWGLDGRATALTAITGPGVQVDGVAVHLSDLEALSDLGLPPAPSAELATDPAIEASAELEHETLPRAGGETHVVVRVRARSEVTPPRGRLRVHLVIDRSSSMQRSWPSVLAAARMLVQRLEPNDEVQIVAYGSDAIQAYPVSRVGDASAAVRALDRIAVGGGTNIEAGLELAYRAAASADASARSLVILLSDGVPNHGAFEPAELGTLVADAREHGCTTSVIGLGTEFDARLLRAVAREGRGGYFVSARLDELAAGLVAELEAHARSAASDLSVRVSLPQGVELLDAGEGGAQAEAGGVVLRVPHLDAGEERSIVLRVRVPGGVRARGVAEVALSYRSGLDGRAVTASKDLDVSFGSRAVVAHAGPAGAAVVDAALASALDAAGEAIVNGDATAALRALDAHADFAEGRVELRRSPALQARVRVVRRLSRAVGALLPGSSYEQRRQVGNAFGALAMRFAR